MRKFLLSLGVASLLVFAIIGMLQVVRGQAQSNPTGTNRETQGDNVREIVAPSDSKAPDKPNISFIDSPSATCYQPDAKQDVCRINWYYASVSAVPNYMITMTIAINNIGIVANVQGFFQTSMYVPYNMLGPGFRVSCGAPGAGGNPELGNAYAYTIRARDSANLASANYGTIYCPAYKP